MTQEALKLALEALEANDQLINGTGTKGGLVYCMDGYYSGCFDVDPINKQTEEAIAAIKEALAQPEQEPLKIFQYNCTCGRTMKFESVHGVVAPQRTEQNFCSRCGKRVGGIDSIHTCTPPMEMNT
jgi:hypothetical protein